MDRQPVHWYRLYDRARGYAAPDPVGSQHVLRALLEDEDLTTAAVLAEIGVTQEALAAVLDKLEARPPADD